MLELHPIYVDAAIRERRAGFVGYHRPRTQESSMKVVVSMPEGAEVVHLGGRGTYLGRTPGGNHVIRYHAGGAVYLDDQEVERQYTDGHLRVVR